MAKTKDAGLELWGGHECTYWRLGSEFRDQSEINGHYDRLDDLDRFASLGIKRLRYPILWEKLAANEGRPDRWKHTDAAIDRLRALQIKPIAGLIHHGSGPPHTNLLDPSFATGLAAHAQEVAVRYPDICDWTPVNEPLTTARFAALYGHWYPHIRDEKLFWIALLNQVDATRLSMKAIRRIIPDARLIQTEDVGRTFSTPHMAEQARFNNERRWASWDLLTGRMVAGHPLYERLCIFGLKDRLAQIADDPSPPDILGINHYLTSDRFLDEQTENYPAEQSSGGAPYADVSAAHLPEGKDGGIRRAIKDSYERYRLPLALTEVHNGCTREEQMRWLDEAWDAAASARNTGTDMVAVCAWSLLGAHDWGSLLTRNVGEYESGVWDIRGPTPRETALAPMLRKLSQQSKADHPVLGRTGWWTSSRPPHHGHPANRPILILGSTGTLGQALGRACMARNLKFHLLSRAELPLGDRAAAVRVLDELRPWAVINAAGWVNIDAAETHSSECMMSNGHYAADLAQLCAEKDIHVTIFSSDMVFGGDKLMPYVETDLTGPVNIYGHSKAQAERRVILADCPALIIRTAAFFSPHDPYNFATQLLSQLEREEPFLAASNIISPTYVSDLAHATLDMVIDGETGIWHVTNGDAISWIDFARLIAGVGHFSAAAIQPASPMDLGWRARRPAYSALKSERSQLLPNLESALSRFAEDYRNIRAR